MHGSLVLSWKDIVADLEDPLGELNVVLHEFAHQIDVERAVTARERAQRQLEEMRQTEHGEKLYEEYQEAYSRAITRIAVSEKKPRA